MKHKIKNTKKITFIPYWVLVLSLLFGTNLGVYAQQSFRIKADFSIKEKKIDGTDQLIMGTVYYDKNTKKIVYDVAFPEPEVWVISDTTLYKFVSDSLQSKQTVPPISESSLFHLLLTGELKDFGLKKAGFTIAEVEQDKNLVIATWKSPKELEPVFGKIMTSEKDKKLYGIIMYNKENQLVGKQVFRKYELVKGLSVPQEVLQISYDPKTKTENMKLTNFKNVVVNELDISEMYDFNID